MYYLFVFSAGIFSVSLFPFLIPIYWLLASSFCLLVCWYRRWLLIFFAGFGFVVGSLLGHHLLSTQLPLFLEGQIFNMTGIIEGLPKNRGQKEHFTLRVETAKNNQGDYIPNLNNRKIQLAWYYRNNTSLALKPGQIWNFTVKLKRPRGFVNPAGFDYQAYLLQQKISATGYILNYNAATLLGQDCSHVMVSCIRWFIKKQLLSKSSNPIALGPILALLIGDTSEINQQQWHLLRSTGTIHLFAISGLHIGIAAAIGFFVGRLCMKLAALLFPFFLHLNYFPGLISIITAALYSLLAGLSLPTQRALSMVVLFHLFGFFNISISPLLLAWALTIVALLDPLAIYNQGFWLSFLAVSLLLYGFSGYKENYQQWIYRFFYSLIKSQWVLAIGLFFPSIILLQGISLSAPIVNLLAVPLVSLFIVPLLFLLIFLMTLSSIGFFNLMYGYCYLIIEELIKLLIAILCWFSSIEFWNPTVNSISLSNGIVLIIIGTVWLIAPRGIPMRYFGLLCFLPVMLANKSPSALVITFMDVGQGTAIVINTKHHTLVYDTGRAFSQQFNAGQHIVVPYLRSKSISKIDKLIVSHNDNDHSGGVSGLLQAMPTLSIVSGQPLAEASPCVAGQQWAWDGVVFEVLWPSNHDSQLPWSYPLVKNNNNSCVLLITYGSQRILLTGDIEARVEKQLLDKKQLKSPIDILLVPHHGSNTSSSLAWLKQLQPKWAVVTAGFNNPYQHPHSDVVNRYQKIGSTLLNTAVVGAIRFSILEKNKEQGEWSLEQWRLDYRHYWY